MGSKIGMGEARASLAFALALMVACSHSSVESTGGQGADMAMQGGDLEGSSSAAQAPKSPAPEPAQQAESPRVETAEVGGLSLSLTMGDCQLRVGERALEVGLKPTCQFIKKGDGEGVMSTYYSDIDSHVLLILGDTAKDIADFPLTQTREDCGQAIRGVVLKDGKVSLSAMESEMLVCAGIGVDEKTFYMLSHPQP